MAKLKNTPSSQIVDLKIKNYDGLAAHILPASATMIGVCMTVLSIGHLGAPSGLRMLIDKMLAINALIFLASALMSFMSMHPRLSNWCSETSAEWTFIAGLGVLALCAFVLAFSIT